MTSIDPPLAARNTCIPCPFDPTGHLPLLASLRPERTGGGARTVGILEARSLGTYGGPRSSRAEPSSRTVPSGRKNLGLPSAISSPNPWWTNR